MRGIMGRMGQMGMVLVGLLIMGILLAGCGLVWAADMVPAHAPAVADSTPADFVAFLNQSVFPVLSALLMGVVTPLIYRLGAKSKIDVLTKKGNFLEKIAFQGISLAEERAAQMVGSRTTLTGSDKLDIAVSHVLSVMPSVTDAQATSMVHALLAQIPGLGATGDTVVSSPGSSTAALASLVPGTVINTAPAAPVPPDPDTIISIVTAALKPAAVATAV
jgi:hypothetical protein